MGLRTRLVEKLAKLPPATHRLGRVENLGSGEPLATGTTLRASEQSIHHAPGRASAIFLPMYRPA
jgi:hypothetical protein